MCRCVSQCLSTSWRSLLEPSCSRHAHQRSLRTRPPGQPARDGVPVFHTLQIRPGRVPPIPRGRWCPRTESLTTLVPRAGPSPAGPCHPRHLPTEGLNVNEGSSTVHLRSPIQAFPLPTRRRQTDDELRLLPWASHPVVTNDARHGGDGPAGHWPEVHAAPARAPPPIHAVTESVRPHVARRATSPTCPMPRPSSSSTPTTGRSRSRSRSVCPNTTFTRG